MTPDSEKNSLLKKAFLQFHDGMVFYAVQYLGGEKDAEDIVQELYVKLWEMEGLDFENGKSLKTYLYRAVRNACLNKLGRREPLRYSIETIYEEVLEERFVEFDDNIMTEIMSEIDKLPPQTRRVFSAVFLDGKKYQQVADELGISINTVKFLLKNGVKQLRKRFQGRESVFLYQIVLLF